MFVNDGKAPNSHMKPGLCSPAAMLAGRMSGDCGHAEYFAVYGIDMGFDIG